MFGMNHGNTVEKSVPGQRGWVCRGISVPVCGQWSGSGKSSRKEVMGEDHRVLSQVTVILQKSIRITIILVTLFIIAEKEVKTWGGGSVGRV